MLEMKIFQYQGIKAVLPFSHIQPQTLMFFAVKTQEKKQKTGQSRRPELDLILIATNIQTVAGTGCN